MSFQVLLYYRYSRIEFPEQYVEDHRALCEGLGLKGRILIAHEGINGTVSGTVEATDRYMEVMEQDPLMEGIEFKVDPAEGHVFPKLSVKLRPELVTLGLSEDEDIDPNVLTGKRLSPAEFREAMKGDDVILLDGRNDYETEAGRFEGAICPDVGNFRDFPDWIRKNLGGEKERRVLTYCTGGIRCEKLSGFLLQEGFADVSQLDGGIVNYGKDESVRGEGFEGQCYVFDQRVVVPVNGTEEGRLITECRYCGEASDRYVNCRYTVCNAQIFVCESCEEERGRFCGSDCSEKAETEGACRPV